MTRRFTNYIVRKISGFLGTNHLASISPALQRIKEINENVAIERYLGDNLLNNPKYVSSKKDYAFSPERFFTKRRGWNH